MSLDVSLYRNRWISYDNCVTHTVDKEEVFTANITHNLNKMAAAVGIYEELWRPEEREYTKAKQLIAPLKHGLKKLEENPDKYKTYNASNGWGTYEGLVKFVKNYLEACKQYPESDIYVSR